MTIPFYCLFAAAVLPYVWFTFAAPWRAKQFGERLDNRTPRTQEKELEGKAARAQGAHMNSLEALAYFGAAVVVAHLTHADASWSAWLALAFIGFRLLHGFAYITDRPRLRTPAFALGLIASTGLFVLAARA